MPPTTTATELSGEYAESAEGLETDQEIGDSEDFVFDKYLAIKLSGDEVSDFTKNLDLLKQQLLLNKKSLIDSQEDLEKIKSDSALGSEVAETFKGYLAEHPIVTEYGGPGSHVDISQAAINNGFVFVLGLVVTSLVATELVTER